MRFRQSPDLRPHLSPEQRALRLGRLQQHLRSRILEAEREKQAQAEAASRKSQVGSGDRSEKIRTYNFPQDRVTDHRIGLTRHNLQKFMDGDIQDVIDALRAHHQAEALRGEV